MRVALVYHCPQTNRRLDDALTEAGALVERFHLDKGDPLPESTGIDGPGLDRPKFDRPKFDRPKFDRPKFDRPKFDRPKFDRVVLLGGAMGAYDVDFHPWLEAEKDWIRGLVAARVPVLGICLGAQLLADALGGAAFKADRPEVGLVPITLTADGTVDRVVSIAGPLVYAQHQDSFILPPDATLLAHSDRFPHAFRLGSVLALQFHPDADLDMALEWGKEDRSMLEAAGVDYEDYARELTRADPQLDRASRAIFKAWLQE